MRHSWVTNRLILSPAVPARSPVDHSGAWCLSPAWSGLPVKMCTLAGARATNRKEPNLFFICKTYESNLIPFTKH